MASASAADGSWVLPSDLSPRDTECRRKDVGNVKRQLYGIALTKVLEIWGILTKRGLGILTGEAEEFEQGRSGDFNRGGLQILTGEAEEF